MKKGEGKNEDNLFMNPRTKNISLVRYARTTEEKNDFDKKKKCEAFNKRRKCVGRGKILKFSRHVFGQFLSICFIHLHVVSYKQGN